MPALASKKKKAIEKKAKPKQKQKQKQIVKTNVKVNVQSAGGGGGTTMPQAFGDRTGENVRLMNLVEQLSRTRVALSKAEPISVTDMPIKTKEEAPIANPSNDAATVAGVFNAPIDTAAPFRALAAKRAQMESQPDMYAGMESPQEEDVITTRRKGGKRGSYKEAAINLGRNIQNEFAARAQQGEQSAPQTQEEQLPFSMYNSAF
jgi:hypothetical protein